MAKWRGGARAGWRRGGKRRALAPLAALNQSSPPDPVIPAQAGIHCRLTLGSRFRGNDGEECEVGLEFGALSPLFRNWGLLHLAT